MNIEELTIPSIRKGLEKKDFSALELTEAFLTRIQEKEKKIHAFLNVTQDIAKEQAQYIDSLVAQKKELPLMAGVPCSVKDAIMVQGVPCTAGSKMLEKYIAPYDATVIQKVKQAGVVIVGKTNMDEFGMGGSTENSAFGPTRNPHDITKVPGGSSGGAGASVAATEAVCSLGEDTGGSIRLPASFCGTVGLKPTYGAVSRYGVISLASSLDQVGPFAKTTEDAEILFNAVKGKDPFDATSIDTPPQNTHADFVLQNLRIGIPKEYFGEGLDSKVKEIIEKAIQKFEHAGAHVEEVQLPHTKYALSCYYVINMSEASANLARYDGIRYGYTTQSGNQDLFGVYVKNRGEGFGTEVKRRIMLGTYALSAGYYDAYYIKAQKVRTLLKQDFDEAFKKVDVIMGPVSPFLPFSIGEKLEDPMAMYLVDIYTVPVNLVGLPALSLPIGKSGNLPVGLHVIAKLFCENTLFNIGKAFEKL